MMTFRHLIFFLSLFFLSSIACANSSHQPTAMPPTANALVLDTKIWQSATIPVCWENYAEVMANSTWKARKTNLFTYLNHDSWGAVTKLNFVDTNKQCPTVKTGFYGVRVLVKTNRPIYLPTKNKYLNTPYTIGLGADLNDYPNGVVLDFDVKQGIYDECNKVYKPFHPIPRESCFKTTVIHEFRHVIGLSHEQNRSDATAGTYGCIFPDALNAQKDPTYSPPPYSKLLIGNIKIGNYDTNSIMNYCNFSHTSQLI